MGIQFEDIFMEILSRLPVWYLGQFKCVSKLWKALISDPYFIKKHLNQAKNDRDSHKLLIYERSFGADISPVYCCPLSSVENVQKLDFPLSTSSRINCVYNGLDGSNERGEILALKSGSWRYIDDHPCGIYSRLTGMYSELAFVNDAFHWMGWPGNYFGVSRTHSLVSFSISNEVYREIPLPEEILRVKDHVHIGVSTLDGMLCVYSTYNQRGRRFKLWALNDYGVMESWNALLIIYDMQIFKAIPRYRFADDEVLFWCVYLLSNACHTFRTSKGPFGLCDDAWDGFAFTESLISPKSLI